MRYNNYHKHTHYSNPMTPDSITKPIDYIKRACELGHTSYFTTEHGYQGDIFEAYTLCQQHGLKCIYAVEAYYVNNMYEKDNSNNHIMLIAMTESGRKQIDKIISKAMTEGFYYKPRIDLECLLSLNPDDVVITTACVASPLFKGDNWKENFFIPVWEHFKSSFYLEVQSHKDDNQINYNFDILRLKKEYGCKLIHGNDSHYIYPQDSIYRDKFVKAKGITYEDEGGFVLDYPSCEIIMNRYKSQGVLTQKEVNEAINNTCIFDNAEGIKLNKEFKIPTIKQDIMKRELQFGDSFQYDNNDKVLKKIISDAWQKEKSKVDPNRIEEYKVAIKDEVKTIEQCHMQNYFILDHMIVKRAVNEYHGIITRSGRGSAVSNYTNKLLGLTEVDRIAAPIVLYPSRFMSAERILNSKSCPDIDLNFASVKPVIKASKDILGEDNIYYMVAFKPLQEASAFRLWCKSEGYNITEYDEIAKNIDDYKDDVKWGQIIKDSERFIGVIESIAPHPCSFLLLDKPISEEIGLIKIKDETCCLITSYYSDVYKYLKNDYLTVTVYKIISQVYKMLGRPIDDIKTLLEKCDDKVWDIYANALTTSINQADSAFAKSTLKRYKPKSLAELSAWVAAIRPGFASLLNNFLDRKPYTTGVKQLDDLLEDSFHYLMYQESIMKYLVWLGIEEKETYDIVKKIAKKKFKENELKELKSKLKEQWKLKVGTDDGFDSTWQVIEDASAYSFNSSHSLSVAIDSLYGAYLKSHYPLEYYTVVLNLYADDTERTKELISELSYFGIKLKSIKFGKSLSNHVPDKATNSIYKGIAAIKYCNDTIAEELMGVYQNVKGKHFIEVLDEISKTSINSKQLNILIGLNFFSDYGKNKKLMAFTDIYNGIKNGSKTILPCIRECKKLSKDRLDLYERFGMTEALIKKYSEKETEKSYTGIDNVGLLKELFDKIPDREMNLTQRINFEKEYLGCIEFKNPKVPDTYYIVTEFKTYKDPCKPYVTLRRICDGEEIKTKVKYAPIFRSNPFALDSILKVNGFTWEYKKKKVNDKWVTLDEREPILEKYERIK